MCCPYGTDYLFFFFFWATLSLLLLFTFKACFFFTIDCELSFLSLKEDVQKVCTAHRESFYSYGLLKAITIKDASFDSAPLCMLFFVDCYLIVGELESEKAKVRELIVLSSHLAYATPEKSPERTVLHKCHSLTRADPIALYLLAFSSHSPLSSAAIGQREFFFEAP